MLRCFKRKKTKTKIKPFADLKVVNVWENKKIIKSVVIEK